MKLNRKVMTVVSGLILALMITVLPDIKASAADVTYVDATVTEGSVTYTGKYLADGAYSVVSSDTTSWGSRDATTWYVVNSNVTFEEDIIVQGDVRLILCDGCTLTASKGIAVTGEGNSLSVYGQTEGTGTLIATGGVEGAGIGGGIGGIVGIGGDGSNITINGGTVKATGGENGAGIGGGENGDGSNITINGGTVEAVGGENGAGIGGEVTVTGINISINNCIIKARNCASEYHIILKQTVKERDISGYPYVFATSTPYTSTTGSLGFAANTANDEALLGTLAAVNGLSVTVDVYSDEACTYSASDSGINVRTDDTTGEVYVSTDATVSCGTYYVGLSVSGSIIGTVRVGKIAVVDSNLTYANVLFSTVLNNADTEVVLLTGSDTTWGTAGKTTWCIADGEVTIDTRVTVAGDVRLILCDGCELKVPKGITVSGDGNSFTVYAGGTADTIEGTGKLSIESVESGDAGIGGRAGGDGSNITITGGTVEATGGENGAGIGGGYEGAGSGISINNCIIKAGSSSSNCQVILKQSVTESDINAYRYVFATSNPYTSTTESLGFIANKANDEVRLGTLAAVNEFNVTFGIYSDEACTRSASSSGINVRTDDTTGAVYVSTDATVSGGTYYVGLVISAGGSSAIQKVGKIKVVINGGGNGKKDEPEYQSGSTIAELPANEEGEESSEKTGPALKESSVTLYLKGDYATSYRLQIENLVEGAKISYKSSNAKIAKVSKKGLITPLKKGSTAITATVKQNGKTYKLKLQCTVKKTSLKFGTSAAKKATEESAATIEVGKTLKTGLRLNGEVVSVYSPENNKDYTVKAVVYSAKTGKKLASSKNAGSNKYLTVSEKGRITGVKAGEYYVEFISNPKGLTSRLYVTVKKAKKTP